MPIENIIFNIISNVRSFNKAMSAPLERFKQLQTATGKWDKRNKEANTRLGRMALGFRKAMHGMRVFRMEMLSVMFFVIGMQRFFSGLLQPALEATGIFELWAAVLQSLFIPIALYLLDVLMPIFEWLMNLSDATKLLIGKWVLFGIAAGVFLAILGIVVLGIGGLILVFGGLFNILDKLIPNVSFLGVEMSSFIEAGLGIGIISSLWQKLKDIVKGLFDKFLELDFVKETMEKLGITLEDGVSLWDQIKTKVSELWAKFKEETGLNNINTELGLMKDSLTEIAKLAKTINDAFSSITSAKSKIDSAIGAIPSTKPFTRKIFGSVKGTNQMGGYIPHNGLYKLHAGETVQQAGASSFNASIVINAGSNVDVEMLKSQLSSQWNDELRRLSRG